MLVGPGLGLVSLSYNRRSVDGYGIESSIYGRNTLLPWIVIWAAGLLFMSIGNLYPFTMKLLFPNRGARGASCSLGLPRLSLLTALLIL